MMTNTKIANTLKLINPLRFFILFPPSLNHDVYFFISVFDMDPQA